MARHNTQLRFEFDFDKNDRWSHQYTDASDFRRNADVIWGCAADSPSSPAVLPGSTAVTKVGGILAATARGSFTIHDRDGRYDPGNPDLSDRYIDQLKLPTPFRVLEDNIESWRGLAVPEYSTAFTPTDSFKWRLEGVHAEAVNSHVSILENFDTVADVTDGDLPVSFKTVHDSLPLGAVTFSGPRVKYWDEYARRSGGWMIENNRGEWQLHTMRDIAERAPILLLGEEYEPNVGAFLGPLEGLVVTRATLESSEWPSSVPVQINLGSQIYEVSGPARIAEYTPPATNTALITSWLTPTSTTADINVLESDPGSRTIRFTIRKHADVAPEIRVSFTAMGIPLLQTNKRTYINEDAEKRYGSRDLMLRPWMNDRLQGGVDIIEGWVDNFSEPFDYFRVSYPIWQQTVAQHRSLLAAQAGARIDLLVPTRQTVRLVPGHILASRISWPENGEPTRTVYGLAVRAPAQAVRLKDLDAYAISPFAVIAQARIRNTGGTLYFRLEEV